MKNIYFFFLLYFPLVVLGRAQKAINKDDFSKIKDYTERIATIKEQCNNAVGSNPNIPEDFAAGVRYGLSGIKYSSEEDIHSKAFFYLITGMSYYNLVQFDSSLYYFRIAADISDKTREPYYIAWGNNALLTIYMQQQQYAKAEIYKDVLQSLIDTTTDQLALTRAYYALGTYYFYQSYYTSSQEYLIKGLEVSQKLLDTTNDNRIRKEYAINYYLLYKIYYNTQLYTKGIQSLKKGSRYMDISQLLKLRYLSAFVDAYTTMESGYRNIDTALKYYNMLKEMPLQLQKGIPSEVVTSALNIGQYYMNEGDLTVANPYIKRADSLAAMSKSPFLIHQVQNVQGKFAYFSGRYDEAIQLLEQSAQISKNLIKGNYVECLTYIAKAYQAKGNLKKALVYYEEAIVQKDSLNAEILSRNIADLEIQHSTKEKEREIISLSNKNKVKEIELKNAARLRLLLIGGLIILGIVSILLYRFYINKEKLNKALNERNEELDKLNAKLAVANETKAKLFGIFSHDLRSPISRIAQFLRLQKENPNLFNDKARKEYHEQFTLTTTNLLNTMEDLLTWSKSQMQNFTPEYHRVSLNLLLNKEMELLKNQLEDKSLAINNEIPDSRIISTDENFMRIIIRNLLQNAVKYSKEKESIYLKAENKETISILNTPANEINADTLNYLLENSEINSDNFGLGLHIVGDLAKKINACIYFENIEEGYIKVCIGLGH